MEEENINPEDIINLIPLDKKTTELAQQIVDEQDVNKVQDLVSLFNLNQAKKNVLRVLKLNSLLDKVSDTAIDRFNRRPGEFTNSDLLSYMQTVQNAIDRANKSLSLVDEAPAIQINQQVNNINVETLDRDSRNKIRDAVNAILKKSKEMEIEPLEDNIIIEESKEEIVENNVYNNKLNEEE